MKTINLYEVNEIDNKMQLEKIKSFRVQNDRFEIGNCIYILSHKLKHNLQPIEHVYLLGCDKQGSITGILHVAYGTENHAEIDKRKVLTFLLLTGSVDYIIAHNHPNNVMYPSNDDVMSAIVMNSLGAIIKTAFKGSYILGTEGYIKVSTPWEV